MHACLSDTEGAGFPFFLDGSPSSAGAGNTKEVLFTALDLLVQARLGHGRRGAIYAGPVLRVVEVLRLRLQNCGIWAVTSSLDATSAIFAVPRRAC